MKLLTRMQLNILHLWCKLRWILASSYLAVAVLGCDAIAYQPSVSQGQIISASQAAQLHPGMTPTKVTDLLGNPVYQNTLNDQRLIYVYTLKPGHRRLRKQKFVVVFKHNKLDHYYRSKKPVSR